MILEDDYFGHWTGDDSADDDYFGHWTNEDPDDEADYDTEDIGWLAPDDPAHWPVTSYDPPAYPGPSDDPEVWINAAGDRLQLDAMTDEHVANALATCVRKDGATHTRTKALLAELTKRSRGKGTL